MKNKLSIFVLVLIAVIYFLSPLLTKRWNNKDSNAVISWDISGYYFYLPSYFYDDLGTLKKAQGLIDKYHPSGDMGFSAHKNPETGYYVFKYSSGQAILYLPAFVVAHFWAKYGGYQVDGFSFPYQFTLVWWAIIFSICCLIFLRKLLLKYFDDAIVALVLFTICLVTNYYNYVCFSGSMTHGYLFGIYCLLLYTTDKWYESPSYGKSIATGFLCGMAALTRPIEVISIIIPILWLVDSKQSFIDRINYLWKRRKHTILLLCTAILIGSIQLFYWKHYAGHWFYWSYDKWDWFEFKNPHFKEGMFSYTKGWFVYTPVMLLIFPGFYFLYNNYRHFFWMAILHTVINLYIVFSWHNWAYGGSFSQRAVIQSYAILSFPLAAFFSYAFSHKWWKFFTSSFLLISLTYNITFHLRANDIYLSGLDGDCMSRAYFWRIFWKQKPDVNDYKLKDTSEELPSEYANKLKLIGENTMTDSVEHCIDKNKQWSEDIHFPINDKNAKWYRASIEVFANEMEWNVWRQAQLMIELKTNGEEIKSNYYRIYRVIEPGKWQNINIDIKTKKNTTATDVTVKIWNSEGEKKLCYKNVSLYDVK